MAILWDVALCSLVEVTDVSVIFSSSIIVLMMAAASISETSVNFYQTTQRYNPEDSHLHTRRREDWKSCFNYIKIYLLWSLDINHTDNEHRAVNYVCSTHMLCNKTWHCLAGTKCFWDYF
jgi:hypothetical protein